MGRFSNKSSQKAKERRNIIKINPYELPERALAIIANICSAQNLDDSSMIYALMKSELSKKNKNGETFTEFIYKNREDLFNIDFYDELLRTLYVELSNELRAHENTSHTQIVVAGGYSAGKSSFLNRITGADNLLPTGIEPVSMVSTYLYCSKNVKDITVKGVNLRNAIVLLDKEVLQSIQHESKSKIYLASVLNKLFVELPSEKLDGFVLIDTPGYNNSDKPNSTNGVTDEDTARKALESGNVLIWIVDAGGGTILQKDREMIEYFFEKNEDGKAVIIFNKADKKGMAEIQRIVDSAYRDFSSFGDKIIDILGYSSSENKIYYSRNQYDMPTLLHKMKECGNGNSGVKKILSDIKQMFEDEIDFFKERISYLNEMRKENIQEKEDLAKFIDDETQDTNTYIDAIKEIIITSYNEILNGANKMTDSSSNALNKWHDFLEGVWDFENNDHWGSSSILDRALEKAGNDYARCVKTHNNISYNYFTEEYRNEWVEGIKILLERIKEELKEEYEKSEKESTEINNNIKRLNSLANEMYNYECILLDNLKVGIRNYQSCAHKVQDVRIDTDCSNVFIAISKGNYANFTSCFAKGVRLDEYTADGYSPVTWAVKEGANDMVQFFIDNDADIYALDKRGYNAFHTAVENGYKDICKLLLDQEPDLATTRTADGKDCKELAREYNFSDWINQMIMQ